MASSDTYYWAGGRKVPLAGSTDVVIDLDSAAAARLTPEEKEAVRGVGRTLSPSLVLVSQEEAAHALGPEQVSGPGVHPVYRAEDGSTIVVLPEVRVEASRPSTLETVQRGLTAAHVTERAEERLVLEPDSGRGEDALTLANSVAESNDTDVAQARFMRIVPRPT